jgi:hypothetical protein
MTSSLHKRGQVRYVCRTQARRTPHQPPFPAHSATHRFTQTLGGGIAARSPDACTVATNPSPCTRVPSSTAHVAPCSLGLPSSSYPCHTEHTPTPTACLQRSAVRGVAEQHGFAAVQVAIEVVRSQLLQAAFVLMVQEVDAVHLDYCKSMACVITTDTNTPTPTYRNTNDTSHSHTCTHAYD